MAKFTKTLQMDPVKVPMSVFPIAGVDPGPTPGLCRINADEYAPGMFNLEAETRPAVWPDDATNIRAWIGNCPTVVVERFWLRPDLARVQAGSTFETVEVIGWIRGLLASWGMLNRLVMYAPGIKTTLNNPNLKEFWSELPPSKPDHERSALRVATYHLLKLSI